MLIDSHCHLFDTRYDKCVKDLVAECVSDGIVKVINIGTHLEESKKYLPTLDQYPEVYTTVGVYPHEEKAKPLDQIISELKEVLHSAKKVVGIGECGIDLSVWENERNEQDQLELFEAQIELALENKLPVVIHNRNGDDQIIELVKKFSGGGRNLTGVVHGTPSSRTWATVKKFLDLGLYVSFAGNVTYPNTPNLAEIVKKVPLDRFLLETDAPYLPPQGHRGEVCYPKYVKMTANKVSALRGLPFEEISEYSYKNTCELFHL
jgi:TatD DNase family protein